MQPEIHRIYSIKLQVLQYSPFLVLFVKVSELLQAIPNLILSVHYNDQYSRFCMLSNRASVHDNHICLFFILTLRHPTLGKKGFHDFTIRSIHLTPIGFNHERMAFQPIFHFLRVCCMLARGWRLLLCVNTDTLENIKEIIQSFTIIGKNTTCRK